MIRSRAVSCLAALLIAVPIAVSLRGQAPVASGGQAPAESKPATAVIVGTVVDADTGQPIAGAAVSIGGASAPLSGQRSQSLTGPDGRFLFTSLAEGSYTLSAQRGGYLPGVYGAIAPQRGGVPVELREGEKRSDLSIKMWKPGSISGRVTDEAGEPLIGITVQAWMRRGGRGAIAGSWTSWRSARTDDRGMYRISSLSPDAYLVFIEQTQASLPSSVLEEFQKQSAILQSAPGQSTPLMTEVFGSRASTATPGMTNARVVGDQVETLNGAGALPTDSDTNAAYVSQFYPAATLPSSATPITVTSGQERSGIDLQLRPVRTVRVTGTVEGPAGPVPFTRVMLSPQHSTNGEVFEAGTVTDASGRFTLLRVPEGAHMLQVLSVPPARNGSTTVMSTVQNANGAVSTTASSTTVPGVPPLPPDPALYAELPIATTEKDIADLTISVRPGPHIKGRIEVPAGATITPAQMQRISVSLVRADGTLGFFSGVAPRTRVDGDGEVTSQGFQPRSYTINTFGMPSNWALKSIMHGGVDVSQVPFDLSTDVDGLIFTFTTTPTELSGVIRDTNSAVVSGALVMIFPADAPLTDDLLKNPRRVVRPIASTSGKYSARNLPPGDYFVAAMAPDDPENISAPAGGKFSVESLATLRAVATRVTIGAGEHRTLDAVTRRR